MRDRVPARPRPRRAQRRVPPPRVQDPGLRQPRRRHVPHAAHALDRGGADRAHGRAHARPQRRPHRGGLPRPRSRPHALRPRRAGRAQRVHARARRLRAQPAVAAGGRDARGEATRRSRAEPHLRDARGDPQALLEPQRARSSAPSGARFLEGRQPEVSRPRSPTSPTRSPTTTTTSTTGCARGLIDVGAAARSTAADRRRAPGEVIAAWPELAERAVIHETVRRMIDRQVADLVRRPRTDRGGRTRLGGGGARADSPLVAFSEAGRGAPARSSAFLREHLYRHYRVHRMTREGAAHRRALFAAFDDDADAAGGGGARAGGALESERGASGRAATSPTTWPARPIATRSPSTSGSVQRRPPLAACSPRFTKPAGGTMRIEAFPIDGPDGATSRRRPRAAPRPAAPPGPVQRPDAGGRRPARARARARCSRSFSRAARRAVASRADGAHRRGPRARVAPRSARSRACGSMPGRPGRRGDDGGARGAPREPAPRQPDRRPRGGRRGSPAGATQAFLRDLAGRWERLQDPHPADPAPRPATRARSPSSSHVVDVPPLEAEQIEPLRRARGWRAPGWPAPDRQRTGRAITLHRASGGSPARMHAAATDLRAKGAASRCACRHPVSAHAARRLPLAALAVALAVIAYLATSHLGATPILRSRRTAPPRWPAAPVRADAGPPSRTASHRTARRERPGAAAASSRATASSTRGRRPRRPNSAEEAESSAESSAEAAESFAEAAESFAEAAETSPARCSNPPPRPPNPPPRRANPPPRRATSAEARPPPGRRILRRWPPRSSAEATARPSRRPLRRGDRISAEAAESSARAAPNPRRGHRAAEAAESSARGGRILRRGGRILRAGAATPLHPRPSRSGTSRRADLRRPIPRLAIGDPRRGLAARPGARPLGHPGPREPQPRDLRRYVPATPGPDDAWFRPSPGRPWHVLLYGLYPSTEAATRGRCSRRRSGGPWPGQRPAVAYRREPAQGGLRRALIPPVTVRIPRAILSVLVRGSRPRSARRRRRLPKGEGGPASSPRRGTPLPGRTAAFGPARKVSARRHRCSRTGSMTAPGSPISSLYQPRFERDSCGIGLIAHMDDQASHWLVRTAIGALARLSHRGAFAADGKTGDGCGLLLKKPRRVPELASRPTSASSSPIALRRGHGLPPARTRPGRRKPAHDRAREVIAEGLEVLGWREVPTDPSVCGEKALALAAAHRAAVRQRAAAWTRTLSSAQALRRRAAQGGEGGRPARRLLLRLQPVGAGSNGSRTRAWCSPANLPPSTRTSDSDARARRCASSTSASRPTPCRSGVSPSRSASSPTTARSTPSRATATGRERAQRQVPDPERCPTSSDIEPLVNRDGFGLEPRQHARGAARRRHGHLPRDAPADPAGLAERRHHGRRSQGVLRVQLHAHGALGRPGGHRADRRPLRGLRAGPQRPAPGALRDHRRPAHHPRLGGRRLRLRAGKTSRPRAGSAPGEMLGGGHRHRRAAAAERHRQHPQAPPPLQAVDAAQRAQAPSKGTFARSRTTAIDDPRDRLRLQKLFQVSFEERDQVLRVLAEAGNEAVGSMGDDTPLAVLSTRAALALRLLPPAVRAGHQPADRPAARKDRDVAGDLVGRERTCSTRRRSTPTRLIANSPVLSQGKFDSPARDGRAEVPPRAST